MLRSETEHRENPHHGGVGRISLAVDSVEGRAARQIDALIEAKKTPLGNLAIGRLVRSVGGAERAETPRSNSCHPLGGDRKARYRGIAPMSSFDSEDEEERGGGLSGLSESEDYDALQDDEHLDSPRSSRSSTSTRHRQSHGGGRGKQGGGGQQVLLSALATACPPTTSSVGACKPLKPVKKKYTNALPGQLTEVPQSVSANKKKRGGSSAYEEVDGLLSDLGERYRDLQEVYEGRENEWRNLIDILREEKKALHQYAAEQAKRDKQNAKKYEGVVKKLQSAEEKGGKATASMSALRQQNQGLKSEIKALKERLKAENAMKRQKVNPLAQQEMKYKQKMELEQMKLHQKAQIELTKNEQKSRDKLTKQMMVRNSINGLSATGAISNGALDRGALMTTVSPTQLSFHLCLDLILWIDEHEQLLWPPKYAAAILPSVSPPAASNSAKPLRSNAAAVVCLPAVRARSAAAVPAVRSASAAAAAPAVRAISAAAAAAPAVRSAISAGVARATGTPATDGRPHVSAAICSDRISAALQSFCPVHATCCWGVGAIGPERWQHERTERAISCQWRHPTEFRSRKRPHYPDNRRLGWCDDHCRGAASSFVYHAKWNRTSSGDC